LIDLDFRRLMQECARSFFIPRFSMFGLLKSVVDLAADVTKVVVAAVEIVADLAGAVVKPVAEAAQELAKDVKSLRD
jgi:hypothetical protein